ncbi:hypothetical protein KIN20_011651 [Parelaphostrongylus tenuis]|uniref:Uncharacterized protein n=1 Tax=Parelaphostrongylus tenuis TaxID=148309 RepID=A0AAD5QL55_PARTN|nr:hypothetical protein KIN20_011651 [Parelaphostrongylus tenuis]
MQTPTTQRLFTRRPREFRVRKLRVENATTRTSEKCRIETFRFEWIKHGERLEELVMTMTRPYTMTPKSKIPILTPLSREKTDGH